MELFYLAKCGEIDNFNNEYIKKIFEEEGLFFKDLNFSPAQFKKYFLNPKMLKK